MIEEARQPGADREIVHGMVLEMRDARLGAAVAGDEATMALMERMNASGRLFVSHTRLRDRYGIRVAIGNGATEWEHVSRVLSFL